MFGVTEPAPSRELSTGPMKEEPHPVGQSNPVRNWMQPTVVDQTARYLFIISSVYLKQIVNCFYYFLS